jgi:hypothetical protein
LWAATDTASRLKGLCRMTKDVGDLSIGFMGLTLFLELPHQLVKTFDQDELIVTGKIYTFWLNMSNNDSGFEEIRDLCYHLVHLLRNKRIIPMAYPLSSGLVGLR